MDERELTVKKIQKASEDQDLDFLISPVKPPSMDFDMQNLISDQASDYDSLKEDKERFTFNNRDPGLFRNRSEMNKRSAP